MSIETAILAVVFALGIALVFGAWAYREPADVS